MRAGRRILYGLVTFLVVSTATLVIGELGVRLAAPQPASWLDVYRRHPTLPLYALAPNVERLVDTGETRWTVFTDADGYRVGKRDARVSRFRDGLRPAALVLGDSFTFGQGVDHEASFVGLLEGDGPVRYANAGVPGYSPVQYRQVLEETLRSWPVAPAVVLVAAFLGNDFHDCVKTRDLPVHDGVVSDEGNLKSAIKRRSHLYRVIARAYHVAISRQDETVPGIRETYDPALWNEGGRMRELAAIFDREMASIVEIARARAIPIVVMLIPPRTGVEGIRDAAGATPLDYDLPGRFVRTRLDALRVPFVDLMPLLARHPADESFFGHDQHFTAFGHRVAADAVRPLIARATAARTTP